MGSWDPSTTRMMAHPAHRMIKVNRLMSSRTETRYSNEDSFRGRARAGTRAHYARARCMGWLIVATCARPGDTPY